MKIHVRGCQRSKLTYQSLGPLDGDPGPTRTNPSLSATDNTLFRRPGDIIKEAGLTRRPQELIQLLVPAGEKGRIW